MIDPGMEYIPPPSTSRKKLHPAPAHIKREAESEDDEGHDREDGFEEPMGRKEALPLSSRGAERRQTTHPEKEDGGGGGTQSPRCAALSLYEERVLLRRLDACPLALAVTPQAKRLHRKLLVRQAKRQRGLPLLDIDRAISATLSLVGGIYGAQEAGPLVRGGANRKYCTSSQELRILDRFQVATVSALEPRVSDSTVLVLSFSSSDVTVYQQIFRKTQRIKAMTQSVMMRFDFWYTSYSFLKFTNPVDMRRLAEIIEKPRPLSVCSFSPGYHGDVIQPGDETLFS